MNRAVLLIILCVGFCVACGTNTVPSDMAGIAPPSATGQSKTSEKRAMIDGTYYYDLSANKNYQLGLKDSLFEGVKPTEIDNILKIFRPFHVEINGDTAIVSFSREVISARLEKISSSAEETKFKLLPLDAKHKDQEAITTINKNQLMIDPGKQEKDKMFFTKAPE
ncbi:MAG: hypothetical protein ACD_62C00318G0002 [uncultured bacterium]|nr:MAG: hypothetical protein ACD_62C00318G0002 [uncultured bacterium]HLD45584.1 hypothetical protein [bacterium]